MPVTITIPMSIGRIAELTDYKYNPALHHRMTGDTGQDNLSNGFYLLIRRYDGSYFFSVMAGEDYFTFRIY